MNHSYPVYTVDAECQDCYKCVRHCPVKAIRVRSGHAAVIPELCVACGKCVEVCPAKAKHVRNDTGRFRLLQSEGVPLIASIAPSWVSEFPDLPEGKFIRALKLLGFAHVGETAVGAQIVSSEAARELDGGVPGLRISSACPTATDFVRKYLPELAGGITPVGSPVMVHARFLKKEFGENIRVVFIGPCIAKKNESDRNGELLALALTYPELKQLFREEGVVPVDLTAEKDDVFEPARAEEGACYPVEGGMNDTIRFQSHNSQVRYAAVTGLKSIRLALSGIGRDSGGEVVFVETLACPGGCVHGPCTEHNSPGLLERLRVLRKTCFPEAPVDHSIGTSIAEDFPAAPPEMPEPDGDLASALRSIGKTSPEDELNCDSCGYDTCRNFARALLAGKAEPSMCVSYLKKQAQKKANALLKSIPSGVVIADKNLNIIECNRNFAALFGEELLDAFNASPGLVGADLTRIVSFPNLLRSALNSGGEIRRDSLRVGNRLFSVNIFTIERGEVVGAVIFDVTNTEMRRELIAERARKVIDKNLATVQEIACRLGEQMADTELLLRSIADDYADDRSLLNGGAASEKPE